MSQTAVASVRDPGPQGSPSTHVTIDPPVLYVGTPIALVTTASPRRVGEHRTDVVGVDAGAHDLPPHKEGRFRSAGGKWTPGGFTAQPSTLVRPPRIAECAIQCEAEVQAIPAPAGPDGEDFRIVEVYVRAVHADRAVVETATGHIDTGAWSPALSVFRECFGTGARLGRTRRR